MITKINSNTSQINSISFGAVPNYQRKLKSTGELKFVTKQSLISIRNAVKDLLKKVKSVSPSKVDVITQKLSDLGIRISDKVNLYSVLGLGSLVSLMPTQDGKDDGFEIVISDSEDKTQRYVFNSQNQVKNLENNNLYTQGELEEFDYDNRIMQILNKLDSKLLSARLAFMEQTYLSPQQLEAIQKRLSKPIKSSKVSEEYPKENVVNNVTKPQTNDIHIIKPIREVVETERYDTSAAADSLRRHLEFSTYEASKDKAWYGVDPNIGRISPREFELNQEIENDLAEIFDLTFEKQALLYGLKKNLPEFVKMRHQRYISLRNIGKDSLNVDIYNFNQRKIRGKIQLFCISDKEGNVLDVLPVHNGRIHKMQKRFEVGSHAFNNYISVSQFYNQEEVESKKLYELLTDIKPVLKKIKTYVTKESGIVDDTLIERLDKKEKLFRKKQKSFKRYKIKNVLQHKSEDGHIYFNNINEAGDKLYYIPGRSNKLFPGLTVFKRISKGKVVDGIAIKNGQIAKNYPSKSNYVPAKIVYYTPFEVSEKGVESKLDEFVTIFENQVKKAVNDLDNRTRTSNIF